ncbi:MAG: DUF2461 domain-containing protein [Ginsengibacter sp.]
MFQPSTLTFLKNLKKNNNKVWFDQNKEKYLAARADFENVVKVLLEKMISSDPDLKDLEPKNCMFRINRDVRFSKNKTPYKINLSAVFAKGGKKSVNAGYYFHLQPGNASFAGGGLWMPEAADLKKVRQEIDYNFPEFKKIISATSFKKIYGELEREEGQVLVNIPKGYDKENIAGEYLKLKSYVATQYLSDENLNDPNLATNVAKSFKALNPLLKFINRSFE